MAGPRHSDQTDVEGLHKPKDFDGAANETALVKGNTGELEYRSLSLLGDTGPAGAPGTTLQNIPVADINDASAELASESGVTDGDALLIHEVVASGPNPTYIYVWDTSVGSIKNDPPFIIPGDGGTWVNADPTFFQGKCSLDNLSASDYHGRIAHVHAQGRFYGLHANALHQVLTRKGYNRSALVGTDVSFHEEVEDKIKTLTLSSNTTLTFSGYQLLNSSLLEIQSPSNETLTLPSYATISGSYDTSGVVNFISCTVTNEGTKSTGTITVTNNALDAGDTIIINGVAFTDLIAGADTTETAFNLCRAISESLSSLIVDDVEPSVSGNVITINAYSGGVAGDLITMVASDGATNNFTLSGPNLTGGVDGEIRVNIAQANDINLTDLQNQVNINTSTGWIDGGNLGVNVDDTLFDIADGNGLIIDASDPNNIIRVELVWTGLDAIVPIALGVNEFTFIALQNVGTVENPVAGVIQQVTNFTSAQRRDVIVLGTLVHVGMIVIERTIDSPSTIIGTANRLEDGKKAVGIIKIGSSSADFTANANDLEIQRSASIHEGAGINIQTDPTDPDRRENPSESPSAFFVNYRDGLGSVVVLVGVTDVDPNFYDNGTGTLVAMPSGKYQIKPMYFGTTGDLNVREYGQEFFDTLGEAEASILNGNHIRNPEIDDSFLLQTWLIVQEGATDLSDTATSKFIQSDKFGQVPFKNYASSLPLASQAEAIAGTANDKLMTPERVLQSLAVNASPATKEMFFSTGSDTGTNQNYSTRSAGSTAASRMTFFIPHDFNSLVSLEIVCWTIANITNQDIDFSSSYALAGENASTNQESDTSSEYSFIANQVTVVDLSGIYTALQAGHFCGLDIDHNGIGTTMHYLGIKLRYT